MLHRLLNRYWDWVEQRAMRDPNIVLLRQELQTVGREYEAMPYEHLLQPAGVLSCRKVVNGLELSFAAEATHVDQNGDIHFCIDARLPGSRWRWMPSYQFKKRRDGSVYY